MKKTTIILLACASFAFVACNQTKKEEQPNVEAAVQEMTQALDTTNAVAPATTVDTAAPATK